MQTLLLTLDFPPRRGGVARYLDALCRELKSVTVLAPKEKGGEEFDRTAPYPIVRRQLINKLVNPSWFPMVLELLHRAQSVEVVLVSHVLPCGTAAWLTKPFTRTPYVVIVHGMDIGLVQRHPWKRWLATRVLRGAKLVVCNSKALEAEVKNVFKVSQTFVAYPTVQPVSQPTQWNHSGLRLLTVSRLVERKGHQRVLEALSLLNDSSIHYDIVGDGPMRKTIESEAERLGVAKQVTLYGDVSDEALAKLYGQADIFVMPVVQSETDREGFGTVYLEAALHSVPSIATRMPGIDEAVIDGETGLLTPDGDIQALATAITQLRDQTLRDRLGSAAASRALSQFTSEKQFGPLISRLQS